MAEKRTITGYPEKDALHWTEETHQRLGKVICMLSQCKPDEWKTGWLEFIYMWDRFFQEEWTNYIEKLDRFRVHHGTMKIFDVINDVAIRINVEGAFKSAAPREIPLSFAWPDTMLSGDIVRESVSQVDLFQ